MLDSNDNWQYFNYKKIKYEIDLKDDKNYIYQKWKDVIIYRMTLYKIHENVYKFINKKLSIFCEIYQKIDNMRPSIVDPTSYLQSVKKHKPAGWIDIHNSIDLIIKDISNFFLNDKNINFEIVKEYYNIITNKKIFLVKDNLGKKFKIDSLNTEIQNKFIEKSIDKIIDLRISYILLPDKRKNIERKIKINNILNNV